MTKFQVAINYDLKQVLIGQITVFSSSTASKWC